MSTVVKVLSSELLQMNPINDKTLRIATFPQDAVAVESLLREYFAWLELPTTHRGFDEEMKDLSAYYSGDVGSLILLEERGSPIGCVALQKHDEGTAEVRRLYVREQYQGQKLGEKLLLEALTLARERRFKRLVLAAIPKTTKAQALYLKVGFERCTPFYAPPVEGTSFYSRLIETNRVEKKSQTA